MRKFQPLDNRPRDWATDLLTAFLAFGIVVIATGTGYVLVHTLEWLCQNF